MTTSVIGKKIARPGKSVAYLRSRSLSIAIAHLTKIDSMTFDPEDHMIGQINLSKYYALPSSFGQRIDRSNQMAYLRDPM